MRPPACWRPAAKPSPAKKALVALGRESQARWPAFAEELARVSGVDVELRREGTLVLALTADDQATIAHHLEFQRRLDLPLEWLSAAATRAREPRLAGKIAGALFSPEDHQVDNRKLAQALRIAAKPLARTSIEHRPVKEIVVQGGRAKGVLLEDGTTVAGRYRRARRRRLVAQHRRIAAGSAAAGASGQRPDVVAADGCGGAAAHPRAVGAGRLSGAAARRPAYRRRHGRGERLRRHDHRRRHADATRSRMARGARGRGIADRRNLGRSSARQPRRCADPWAAARWKACSMQRAIIATAFCWRR